MIEAPPTNGEREHRDVLGQPLLAHEPLVQAAPLAAGEELRGDVERVEPAIPEDGGPEPDVDARQRDPVLDDLAALLADQRRQRQVRQRRDGGLAGIGPKYRSAQRADLRAIAVARRPSRTALFGA